MIEVVAALVRRDGRFMICQRGKEKSRALLWEFPGGKVERGETKSQALVRECREELAIDLQVGEPYMEVTHDYPDVSIHLTLLEARIVGGEPTCLEHNDLRFIAPQEIDDYAFCSADQVFLPKLRAEGQPSASMNQ